MCTRFTGSIDGRITMNRSYSTGELAELVGGTLRGRGDVLIRGLADLDEAGSDQISWVNRPKYADRAARSNAGALLVPKDFGPMPIPAILCSDVDRSLAKLLRAFAPARTSPTPGIDATACVHPSARIGEGASIGHHAVIEAEVEIGARTIVGPGVFIGEGTTVGDDCRFWPNAVIRDGCRIGHRVEIHPNSVIGADGFGYYFADGVHNKVPHIGGVILEDDVEIGACTCVDRAKFGFTIVGKGTKIDNLVQIGHNCRLGRHNVIAGQVGISGSCQTGDYCAMGGRSGISDHVRVGDRARVAVVSIVTHDIAPGVTVSGTPAQEHRKELRQQALLRKLPDWAELLKQLGARVERLEAATHHQSGG